jgi:predicted DCC family thiol-disulfide oxidoreductase YuxK
MSGVVLFDGVCNFCHASVNFIIERDRKGYFRFAPLQSDTGRELASQYGLAARNADAVSIDSLILIEGGKAYTYSTGALRIARHLDGLWPALYVFILVPRPVRDFLYRSFARYRYRLFGRKDECMIPTPEVRMRFL